MKPSLALILVSILFIGIAACFVLVGSDFDATVLMLRTNSLIQLILIAVILSASGSILQTLLSNPLAEPYVLGVSSGACLGTVIAVFLSLTPLLLTRTAFSLIGAMAVVGLIWVFGNRNGRFSIGGAVLAGVGFNALFSAGILLLQNLLLPNDLRSSIQWMMGSVDFAGTGEIVLLAIGALTQIVYIAAFGRELEIYRTGDEMAMAVGVDTSRLKRFGLLTAGFGTACAVSVAGMIGFIGLIVPHIVRMTFGEKTRLNLPALILVGGTLLVAAGWIARLTSQAASLPIGVVTSLIGAPFFIGILLTKWKGE